ncbi:MAG TPA: SLC13 family permease [Pirellulaceae bacterium]|nr:SLC13 family permease [Pirellulaceae bacterium]HMO91150.1 SLC13 family permease [Pirellulaceae bacterium]HMP69079.1 SLC13 family permease [Pirellulaceae bacterium]
MAWEAWFTLSLIGALFIALVRNLASTDVLFVTVVVVLAVCGIITPEQAFAGFSNAGMLTVAFLFVVAAGLRETGFIDYIGHRLLRRASTPKGLFVRLSAVALPFSAFLNNTPIVAIFVPIVLNWSRRHQVSPSRVLIPLSFITILGGTCTLIGTSTNLVVNGLLIAQGMPGMHLFEIGAIGLPYACIGLTYLFFFGGRLLPDRKELLEQLGEARREFLVEMLVQPNCRFVGQSIEAAGLRHLPGLFLIEIDRDNQLISPVGPDEIIQANDQMVFTGVVSSIVELEKIPGFVPVIDPSYEVYPRQQRRRRLCEAVISVSSPLIGKTIREADFRASYGAAIVAVHRGGSRVARKLGDIRLRNGDTLLLQTQPNFQRAYRNDPAFYLISEVDDWRPMRSDRAWIALGILILLIATMATGLLPSILAAAVAGALMILMGCISAGEARKSIEWQVLITIAAAFGVGAALQNSGAAEAIVNLVFGSIKGLGPVVALAGIYLLGSLITELLTNNAAAVLMFPFCIETANLYESSPMPFVVALMLAASASFMTPIGYQTNLMVYGPGGYRFTDFIKIGAPLNIILGFTAVVLVPLIWKF